MDNTYFANWLKEQMKAKGWRQSDLAHAAHVDPAVVSNLFKGKRGPGLESCRAFATALGISPNIVFEAAGFLKPKGALGNDAYTAEITSIYEKFNRENKREALEILRTLLRLQEEQEEINAEPLPTTP